MLTVFVDSNFFIQCKPIEHLDWKLISECDITIIVPLTVAREIDSFKSDGNRRRASRSKKILPFIKKLSKGNNHNIIYGNQNIILMMAERIPHNNSINTILDLNQSDDRIINELLLWKYKYDVDNIALLSDDSGVHITCSQCGIECIDIPENWFLPPEKDEIEREILALKEEIKLLKHDSPEIEIKSNINGVNAKIFEKKVFLYDELCYSKKDELKAMVLSSAPLVKDFTQPTTYHGLSSVVVPHIYTMACHEKSWREPTKEAIERYNERYQEWVDSVEDFFSTLPSRLNKYSQSAEIVFEISSSGVRPAEGVLVEFEVMGDFLISSLNGERTSFDDKIPYPPSPPAGRLQNTFEMLFQMEKFFAQQDRLFVGLKIPEVPSLDRFAFYEKKSEAPQKHQKFYAQEFRHETKKSFSIVICPKKMDSSCSGILKCNVSAKNLKMSISHTVNLRMEFIQGDIEDKLRSIIEQTCTTISWLMGEAKEKE